jgi:hypothetical protein
MGEEDSAQLTADGTQGVWSVSAGVLSAGLTLDTATGVVGGTPTVSGDVEVTFKITNGCGEATKVVTISVCEVAEITNPGSGDPNIGADVVVIEDLFVTGEEEEFQFTHSGSHGVWSVSAGVLPAGLTLVANNGKLTGTPTESGEFDFTVKLTTPCCEVSKDVKMFVCLKPGIKGSGYINGVMSETLTYTLEFEGTTPGTWSITGNLPAGLSLNTNTGVISGTPTVYGDFRPTVTVTNDCGNESKELHIQIDDIHKLIFTVVDENDQPILSPNISIDNTITLINDGDGIYSDDTVKDGDYPYTVSKEGYVSKTGTAKVTGNAAEDINIKVVLAKTTRRLTFNVVDEEDNPITDATIEVTGEGGNLSPFSNMGDGTYVYDKVPPGEYEYSVSKDGYTTVTDTVSITVSDVEVEVKLVLDIHAIVFTVINNSGSFSPASYDDSFDVGGRLIADASVACGTLSMTNNDDGTYDSEAKGGEYAYTISKETFITQKGTVEVTNKDVAMDILLSPIVGNIKLNAAVELTSTALTATVTASPALSNYKYDWSLWNKDTPEAAIQTALDTGSATWTPVVSSTNQNKPLEVRCTIKEPVDSGISSFACTPVPAWRVTQLNPTLKTDKTNMIRGDGETFIATCTVTTGMQPFEYEFVIYDTDTKEILLTSVQSSNTYTYEPKKYGKLEIRCTVRVKDIPIEYNADGVSSKAATPVVVNVYDPIVATVKTEKETVSEDELINVSCEYTGALAPYRFAWTVWRLDNNTQITTAGATATTTTPYHSFTPNLFVASDLSGTKDVEFRCTVSSTGLTPNPSSAATPATIHVVREPFEWVSVTVEEDSSVWMPGTTFHAIIEVSGGVNPITFQRRLNNPTNGTLISLAACTQKFEFMWPTSVAANVEYVTLYCTATDKKGRVISGELRLDNIMHGKLFGSITFNQKKPTGSISASPSGELNTYTINQFGGVGTMYYDWKIYDNKTDELIEEIPQTTGVGTNPTSSISWAIPERIAQYEARLRQGK